MSLSYGLPASYLALGDSYTIGEGVQESERWTFQAAEQLRSSGFSIQNPVTIARTGWTTGELITAIEASNHQDTYDLVSLLIGVNNQYRGNSVDEFQNEFRELLQIAVHFAGDDQRKVFVVSIPDWSVTPFAAGRNRRAIAGEIDFFNRIARDECVNVSVPFVEITGLSRRANDDLRLLAADNLHYSKEMYALWASEVVPVIKSILSSNP